MKFNFFYMPLICCSIVQAGPIDDGSAETTDTTTIQKQAATTGMHSQSKQAVIKEVNKKQPFYDSPCGASGRNCLTESR